ncbi:MAG: hypothetical protein V4864_02375 [Pseudomonadota bacterium]
MADGIRHLTLDEAIALHASFAAPRPGTLHPLYVEADARRDAALQPAYLTYSHQGQHWMHALHLTRVPGTDWLDASSPYGYGGPLSSSDDPGFIGQAWAAYTQWMREQRVVVEYVRFHPVLANERHYGGTVETNREVVCIDLQANDAVEMGYASRLRTTLKKAARAPLAYREEPLGPLAAAFGRCYRAAMQEIGADPFYLFDDAYFEQLASTGLVTLGICTLQHGSADDWLAACLLLDGAGMREYHLAATNAQGRPWGASSFALDQAARAAQRRGARAFYLGGGTDRRPDNALLFFKSAFSGQRLMYRTGATVFNDTAYEELKQRFPAAWQAHPERPIFYRKV